MTGIGLVVVALTALSSNADALSVPSPPATLSERLSPAQAQQQSRDDDELQITAPSLRVQVQPAPAPPTRSISFDRDPLIVAGVQMAGAAVAGVVLAPIAWGAPFAAVELFFPDAPVETGARVLLGLSLISVVLFAPAVAIAASVVGAIFGRARAPDWRLLVAGVAAATTAAICGGGIALSLFAGTTLVATSVGFWLVGLPMAAVVSGASGTAVAVYLEGRALQESSPPLSRAESSGSRSMGVAMSY